MSSLYLLWDEAQLWGLLLCHAARSLGISHRLVRADEISGGILQKRPPSLLIVPGGSARQKAAALGRSGLEAIRAYVRSGGNYAGFCGGAGLGLSETGKKDEHASLGLCPWERGAYAERLQHFMSGHVRVELASQNGRRLVPSAGDKPEAMLPVWWPGQFGPEKATPPGRDVVEILARYATARTLSAEGETGEENSEPSAGEYIPEFCGRDFWLADLPISSLPRDVFSSWHDLYGLNVSPVFLSGQPCVVCGSYGKGAYILSYSHLETPGSPFANAWLIRLLSELGRVKANGALVAEWNLGVTGLENAARPESPAAWDDPDLIRAMSLLRRALVSGLNHGLLFRRSPWLLGWRSGLPGAALNNLYAELYTILERAPNDRALKFWRAEREKFMPLMTFFAAGTENYLLAERLALTLNRSLPEAVSGDLLRAQKQNLFGSPMRPGGLYSDLLRVVDELAFLQITAPEANQP